MELTITKKYIVLPDKYKIYGIYRVYNKEKHIDWNYIYLGNNLFYKRVRFDGIRLKLFLSTEELELISDLLMLTEPQEIRDDDRLYKDWWEKVPEEHKAQSLSLRNYCEWKKYDKGQGAEINIARDWF